MLTSWCRLLDGLAEAAGGDIALASDIMQLRGLAVRQDQTAFLPVHGEEMGPDFARRIASYCQLADDLIGRGAGEKWITTAGLKATPQRWGYGRYFRFVDQKNWKSGIHWLGVNHEQWSKSGDTPLWLLCASGQSGVGMAAIAAQLRVRHSGHWIPIHLRREAEYQAVLDDASEALKSIARILGANLADE